MNKVKKICILINHHEDINLFSKDFLDSSDLYCKNFHVKLGLKNKNFNIKELKFKNFLNKKSNFFFNFKSNWFKDEHKNDYTLFEKKFSIGNVTKNYITRDLITFLKNYYLYLKLKKNYNKIFISSKESIFFKKFVDTSKNKFIYYKSKNIYPAFCERDVVTKFDCNLIKVKKYFLVFRIIQNFFKFNFLNKFLIFNDPSLKNFFKKKNYLVLNSINIFKSFYFKKPNIIKKKFPNNIKPILKKKLIKLNLPDDFVNVFSEHVHDKLKNHFNLFYNYYLMIDETLIFYKPKMITVPSLLTFQSILTQYACINNNVEVMLATDGSNMNLFNDIPFNRQHITKYKINIVAYSSEEQKFFKKYVNNKNIKLYPFQLNLNFKKNLKKKYDLIILDYFWSFNDNSINSKRDYSYKILDDILTTVHNSNKKNIAIKFKKTSSKSYYDYQKFVKKNILKNFSKLNIEFLDGDFSEALNFSNIFIGDIGTSLVETVYAKKKYIIYSPIEIGYNDSFVNKHSLYIKSNQVVRNLSQLKQQIKSKEKIKLTKLLTN